MRYWLRAALGANAGDDIKTLSQAESEVFGNTEKASPIVVRIRGQPRYSALERRPEKTSGFNYLYWSLFLQHKGNPRCIASGLNFEVSLGLRPGIHQEQLLWKASAALWLVIRLGGLGSRSRRTLGSLAVKREPCLNSNFTLPPFVSMACDPAALTAELEFGLRTVSDIVGGGVEREPARKFNVLHRDRCSIWVVTGDEPWITWEDAAEDMGTALQSFRRGLSRRQKAALGLPFKGAPGDLKNSYSRYASPLILTLARLQNGGLVGIVVGFEPVIEPPNDFKGDLVYPFVEQFSVRREVAL
jgi:CRISPR-associated protein Cmr1